MSLRVAVWHPIDERILAPLRSSSDVHLIEDLPRHRWPWAFWPLRVVAPFLTLTGSLEDALAHWPASLLDSLLATLRAGQRWPVLLFPLLPLLWLPYIVSQLLIALLRCLVAPLRAYQSVASLLENHPSMRLSDEERARRTSCDLWLVGPGFPYPAGHKAIAVTNDPPARLWALSILDPDTSPLDALRSAIDHPPPRDPLPVLLTKPPPAGLPHVHLFLPTAFQGGTWEAAHTLVAALVEINRARRQMTLSLAVPPDQPLTGLTISPEELTVERFLLRTVDGQTVPYSPSLLRASVWFALADRFPAPLLPARPYGLVLHDVIHRFVPESYPLDFHTRYWPALLQTVQNASCVLTTTNATRSDVLTAYALPPERVALVPVACEPHRRFAGLVPPPAPLPAGYILNPTNAAPHKGAELLLEAFAHVRRCLPHSPPLVLCGNDTDRLAPDATGPVTAYWSRIRRLVTCLGLRPGQDVYFLGYVDDAALMGLLQNAAVVVNAACHDNGTYGLIEAHYFGRTTVSTRYPAAVELYDRFAVPVHYSPAGCPASLAAVLQETLNAPALSPQALSQARQALQNPELAFRTYAERVYDHLLQMVPQPAPQIIFPTS